MAGFAQTVAKQLYIAAVGWVGLTNRDECLQLMAQVGLHFASGLTETLALDGLLPFVATLVRKLTCGIGDVLQTRADKQRKSR